MNDLIVPVIMLLVIAFFANAAFKALIIQTDKQDRQDKYQDDMNIHHDKFIEILNIVNKIEAKCEPQDKAALMMFQMKIREFVELVDNDSYWLENPFYDVDEMLQQAEFFFGQYGYNDRKGILKFVNLPD